MVLSCTVSEILPVFMLLAHPHSTLILGLFPLYQIARVGVSVNRDFKLFGREIIFEVSITTYMITGNVTDTRTDDMQCHNRVLRSIAR